MERMRHLFMFSSDMPVADTIGSRRHLETRRKQRLRQPRATVASPVVFLTLLAVAAAGGAEVRAQEFATRATIWDLRLGMDVRSVPALNYQDYACGSNGGPAALPLGSFADFRECRTELSGLYEVQFRYDDEAEFVARAYEAEALIERFEGTRPFGHPAIVSALIDDQGVLRGLRIVTDNRVGDEQRMAAFTFAHAYRARFGEDGWRCEEGEPNEIKRPVGEAFEDSRCIKQTEEATLVVESHFYRRPGQFAIDPVSGRPTSGEFTSSARFEMYERQYGPAE